MADILIKGMKMPKSCADCLLQVPYDGYNCCLVDNAVGWDNETRPDWCLLTELPLHGRLGDLDAVEKSIVFVFNNFCGDNPDYVNGYENGLIHAQDIVRNTPTVIPASEG